MVFTAWKTSTTCSAFTLSSTVYSVQNAPVRPRPSLERGGQEEGGRRKEGGGEKREEEKERRGRREEKGGEKRESRADHTLLNNILPICACTRRSQLP